MIGAPQFDEQSARIVLYILLHEAGEVWGYTCAPADEPDVDGVSYRPTVCRWGHEIWTGQAVRGTPNDDAACRNMATDVGRLKAITLILQEGETNRQLCESTLVRFRRDWADPSKNTITREDKTQ